MVFKDELIVKVRRFFNLNLYETKIWLALLSKGSATAGELSDLTGVPRSRSYDVLESLERKGLVILKFDKPIRYLVVSPAEAIERVKKYIEESAKQKISRLEELKSSETYKEIKTLYESGSKVLETEEIAATIKGRKNVCAHLEMLIKNAQKSITLISSPQLLLKDSFKAALEKAKKRGVELNIATLSNKEIKEFLKFSNLINYDCQSRIAIIDSNEVFIAPMYELEVHPNHDMGIWLKSKALAQTIENFVVK